MENETTQAKKAGGNEVKKPQAKKTSNDAKTIEVHQELSIAIMRKSRMKNKHNERVLRQIKELTEKYNELDPGGEVAKQSKTLFIKGFQPKVVKIAAGIICPIEIVDKISAKDKKKYKIF